MWRLFVLLALTAAVPARANEWFVLPSVEFSAKAVHVAGPVRIIETIHYADGKLRIDRGDGFSTTILDLKTQSEALLMVNHTYLLLPMDNELFRRFIAQPVDVTGARVIGHQRIEGFETTKYAFGDAGALDAAGSYWLTKSGIMVRRDYDDGVYGENRHNQVFLTDIHIGKQPAALFTIPAGYRKAK